MNRKYISFICLLLAFTLFFYGCGGNTVPADTTPQQEQTAGDSPIGDRTAVTLSEPVTVTFWHTSTGSMADVLESQIREFNSSNGMGITVVGIYKGSSSDILDLVKENYASGKVANIVVTTAGITETLAEAGVLADMSAYVERDGFDMSNIPQSLRYYSEYYAGKIIQFPYLVNASIIYYNKAYYPDGFPTTLEDWIEAAQSITQENPGVYGMGLPLDTGYIQRPLLRSLGTTGLTTQGGTAPAALDDGTLEQFMTDWSSWIDGGYCISVNGTNIPTEFMSGRVAAFPISCVNTVDYAKQAEEVGIDLGYAPTVAYGGTAGGLGGAGICLLDSSSDQELAASWEFIKFLYEDQQVVDNAITGSFVPLTYSAAQSAELQEYWDTYPGTKVAFEALDHATYNEWSAQLVQWRNEISGMFREVLNSKTLTPAEAVEQLQRKALTVFRSN